MRYLALIPILLLAACGSQSRDTSPGDDYSPHSDTPRPTYDEGYRPPARMTADQLVARAKDYERTGRDDRARVEYHAAFQRDRWHAAANTGYQDLMVRNDLWDFLWHEYLDLWQQHPDRGDALWFHLRPMFLKRKGESLPTERRPQLTPEQIDRVNELTALAVDHSQGGNRDAAVRAIDQAIELADYPILHRVRIELLQPVDYDGLLEQYSDRADENPASGDNLYLHAKVLSYTSLEAALHTLRGGWILGVPGWWLRYGMAEFSIALADQQFQAALRGEDDARRSVLGYFGIAESCLLACLDVRPNDPDANSSLAYLRTQRDRLK